MIGKLPVPQTDQSCPVMTQSVDDNKHSDDPKTRVQNRDNNGLNTESVDKNQMCHQSEDHAGDCTSKFIENNLQEHERCKDNREICEDNVDEIDISKNVQEIHSSHECVLDEKTCDKRNHLSNKCDESPVESTENVNKPGESWFHKDISDDEMETDENDSRPSETIAETTTNRKKVTETSTLSGIHNRKCIFEVLGDLQKDTQREPM